VQLQQVVLNLIMNAAEAMDSGPAGARHLHVESGKDEVGNVVVAIGDSGPGFPPGDTERIFDAFFSTKTGGLGMGLSIGRSIVDAHGGRLWADSGEGSGATFRFTIPPDA
jgi:signal transduction histidine kinase